MKYGSPKEIFFDWDGLHLSQDGSKVMQRYFLDQFSYIIKNMKLKELKCDEIKIETQGYSHLL